MGIYSFFIILGCLSAFGLVFYLAKKSGRPNLEVLDLNIIIFMSALFGAKLFHVLFEAKGHKLSNNQVANNLWGLLRDDPFHMFKFLSPGYVLYGGIIFGVLGGLGCLRRKRELIELYADIWAVALSLGLFFGRLGCFFAGCCYGNLTDLPWGVWHPQDLNHEVGLLHPVQLYEAFSALIFFALSFRMGNSAKSSLFVKFLLYYSTIRFFLEFLRADSDRGIWLLDLSTSQWVSVSIILAIFIMGFGKLLRKPALTKPLQIGLIGPCRRPKSPICHYD